MSELFSETSRQFGLAVGLLVVAVVALARVAYVLYGDLKSRSEREIAELRAENDELKVERDLYRDRWIEAVSVAEVGKEATRRLVRGDRRPPTGGR